MRLGDRIVRIDPASVRAVFADPVASEFLKRAVAESQRLQAGRVNGITDEKVSLVCGACNKRMFEVVVTVKATPYFPAWKYSILENSRGHWTDRAGPNTTDTKDGDVAAMDDLIGPRASRALLSCPCGAEWPVRKERLSAAYKAAAAPRGSRRIVVPTDLPD